MKKKRRKKRLPRFLFLDRRPSLCLQRQVPAVQRVLSSSSSTTFGHSCCATETGTHSANFTIHVQFLGKDFVPVVVQRQVRGPMVHKTVVSRSCSPSQVVDFLFVPQRQIPMVLPVWKTIETPQLQYVAWWSIPLLCRSCLTCLSL